MTNYFIQSIVFYITIRYNYTKECSGSWAHLYSFMKNGGGVYD